MGAGCPSFDGQRPAAAAREKGETCVVRVSGGVEARVALGCRLGVRSGSRLAAAAQVVSILAMRAIAGIATLWPNPSIERTF